MRPALSLRLLSIFLTLFLTSCLTLLASACGSGAKPEATDAGQGASDAAALAELGEACTSGADCASSHCFAVAEGQAVCSECEIDRCEDNERQDCVVRGAFATCEDAFELGASCEDGASCRSGFCQDGLCSLCEATEDCFLDLACVFEEGSGYSLCVDPNDERVNADRSADGSFERYGCNDDCNGCICDADADGTADGICVGHECIGATEEEPFPTVVLDCGTDACDEADLGSDAFTTCMGNAGLSCAFPTELSDGATFYEQMGMCLCFTEDFCQCQGRAPDGGGDVACLDDGLVLHASSCSEGLPCDDTYVGNFDASYGVTTDDGLCEPAVCDSTTERVDVDADGTFAQCGCAFNSQGTLCQVDGTLGLCAGTDCVTTAPVSRRCSGESCNTEAQAGCVAPGWACDSAFPRAGQTAFEQDGFCASVGDSLACVTSGDVCRPTPFSEELVADCANCDDGSPCDATLGDAAFDSSYGTCQAGNCVANVIPAAFDWRNRDGQDWTTRAKDQQSIGACTAFGVLSSIEAKWNIQSGDANLNIDLSEQDALNCDGVNAFGSGIVTLEYALETGLPDESCVPWENDANLSCEACPDADERRYFVSGYHRVENYRNEIKMRIMRDGPLVASMLAGGMTRDSAGLYYCPVSTGGHVVSLVGWNDAAGYWILKNSWGAAWNGDGFFKLRYGECGLDAEFSVDRVIAP